MIRESLTVTLQQTVTTNLPTASQLRRAERAKKFKKLGAALSSLAKKNWLDVDYHTGKPSEFELKRFDKHNREGQDVEGRGTEVPLGPKFNTPQWDRTVPR